MLLDYYNKSYSLFRNIKLNENAKSRRLISNIQSNYDYHKLKVPPVLYSLSHDVHLNLALEDWIYQKCDWTFTNRRVLMLWRNEPCVVIGRHQNPWLECRLGTMDKYGVKLARRNSGGGAVFHDLGNLNCTFFTARSAYNRHENLQLICNAIKKRWPHIDVNISAREDILTDGHYKISGTASKLGGKAAYHHCTLMCHVDTNLLRNVLRPINDIIVDSKATASIRSPVKNIDDVIDDELIAAITEEFNDAQLPYQLPVMIQPTEEAFPGLTTILENYSSWEWIFQRCPPFKIQSTHTLPQDSKFSKFPTKTFVLQLSCQQGRIVSINVTPDSWLTSSDKQTLQKFVDLKLPITIQCSNQLQNLSHNYISEIITKNLNELL